MPHYPTPFRFRSARFIVVAMLSIMMCAALPFTLGRAQDHEQERETSRLLAILFDSGRVVVGMNQELINDVSKGDKGFTPDVFETQLRAVFEQRTGISLSDSNGKIPAIALIVLWMKVRGLSPGTRHPSIFPEFAIRDSFRRRSARRLLPASRHGPASTSDKSPRKDF
jgi:hypothetical protein